MKKFLQLHILTDYAPSNPNRGEDSLPKTAIYGGKTRLRISSQSLKRTWRTSSAFETIAKQGNRGERTKRLGLQVHDDLIEGGVDAKKAFDWAKKIAGQFGKNAGKSKDDKLAELQIEQLVHISPRERARLDEIVAALIARKDEKAKELDKWLTSELKSVLGQDHMAADIAMFGRMLASDTNNNVEAAVQVAHALTTHAVVIEDDYFTAVDDLNQDESGAAFIGHNRFSSGLFYIYVNIDLEQLIKNLGGDTDLAQDTLESLTRACLTTTPSGKQNSYGSRTYAHYALAELSSLQPRQLSLAFHQPVSTAAALTDSRERLRDVRDKMNAAYNITSEELTDCELSPLDGVGSLNEFVAFARQGVTA